jgi:hypothetical protein
MKARLGSIRVGGNTADHHQFVPVRGKRLERFTEFKFDALSFRLPPVLVHTQRVNDESQTPYGSGGSESIRP